MAVSRDRSQHFPVRFQQHPIQVITDVLLRHREVGLVQKPLQIGLGKLQRLLLRQFVDHREVGGGEGGENEAAAAAADGDFVAILRDRERDALRQGAADVQELPARHRDLPVSAGFDFSRCHELDLKVRCRDRKLSLFCRQEQVRENRHRLAPLDDADDGLKCSQQRFAFSTEFHLCTWYELMILMTVVVIEQRNSSGKALKID